MKVRFKRDDGEQLEISQSDGFYLNADDEWFDAKPIRNSTVAYQDADGGQLVKQNYDMFPFTVSGFIRTDSGAKSWEAHGKLFRFFQKGHYFTTIFTRCDGVEMANSTVFISTPLQVALQGKSDRFMTWNIQLTLGDPYLYEYAEDDQGNEIYANQVVVTKIRTDSGTKGYQHVANGYIYYRGGYRYTGGLTSTVPVINLESQTSVLPVWVVEGPATNPTLTNRATNETISWSGTLVAGQTLTISTKDRTAFIGTANVTNNLMGEWLTLQPGANQMLFETDNEGDVNQSTIEYDGVVF